MLHEILMIITYYDTHYSMTVCHMILAQRMIMHLRPSTDQRMTGYRNKPATV